MNKRTDEEILAEVYRLWPRLGRAVGRGKNNAVKVVRGAGYLDISIGQMYESPGFSFAHLEGLAKFFDTKNVETESEFRYGGCETCDFGSEYGFVLRIRPGDSPKETP